MNDEIDTSGPLPRHLNMLAEDLIKGKVTFSGPQLYQLLKILKELQDLDFSENKLETSDGDRSEDEDWQIFAAKLDASKRGLCSISLLNYLEDPTLEAWKTITTL